MSPLSDSFVYILRVVGFFRGMTWIHATSLVSLDFEAVNRALLGCTTRNRFGGLASFCALRGSDMVIRFLVCAGPFAVLLRFDNTALEVRCERSVDSFLAAAENSCR